MLHELKFLSFNERDQVYGWIYVPACKPMGIIQLIHGFGEHSRRYLHMITSFMEAGYIVAADDHVGHGKTALENDSWGNWGEKGFTTMMEDEKKLHDLVCEMYPDLPFLEFNPNKFLLWQDDSLKQLQVVHQPWILPSDTESEGVEAEQEKRE